ncbi:MAG: lysophospholipase [Kofleriaceae bacterium]
MRLVAIAALAWGAPALIALAACAHTPDLDLRPMTTPAGGPSAEVVQMRDGTDLATLTWKASDPRGVVVIVHGLKDHAKRYVAFAEKLVANNYHVVAFDLRGHAHSSGPRVSPRRWRDYVDDAKRVIQSAGAHGGPVFVFGHSMGGAIAILAALDIQAENKQPTSPSMVPTKLDGVILSAPAVALDAGPLLLAATRMAGALTPGAKALDLPNEDFSSDPAVEKAMAADPLIEQGPGPARTAAGLIDAMREIWERTDEVVFPILALHGTRDALTAPSGSRELIRAVPSSDKTLKIYDGFHHDLLHEPKGARVADDILAWLDAHAKAEPIVATPMFSGRLRGEPGEWLQAVSFSGGVHGLENDDTGDFGFAGLAAIHVGKMRPFGWHGSITGQTIGEYRAASLRPLGVMGRLGASALGLSGGVSLITNAKIAVSFGAFAELPLGPAHFSLIAERQRGIENTNDHGPLAADLLMTALSVRYGGDRRYWPHAVAGVGPVITGGIDWVGSAPADWFITLGLQLYGAD